MKPIAAEIIEIVAEKCGNWKEEVSLDDTLLGELGIDGDDAWEILEKLSKNFEIDFFNFDFGKHFRTEPCSKGPIYTFRKFKRQDEHASAGKVPITVGTLIAACEKGEWKNDV